MAESGHTRGEPPPLKVLIIYAQPVFWSMGEGSGSVAFSRLPAAIAARGHAVHVSLPAEVASRTWRTDSPPPPQDYRGFVLHRAPAPRSFVPDPNLPLPARLGRRASCWLQYQRWGLAAGRRLVSSLRPDLVIGMGFYEAPVARRLAHTLGVPNVTRVFGTILSLNLHDPLRFYANFPEVIGLRTPAERIILTDDGGDGEGVVRRLRIRPDRVLHLRNGVDFDLFRPGRAPGEIRERLGLRPDQPLLLTATRLAPEKKLERAIETLERLRRHRPDAALALLGDGPERASLREFTAQLGLERHVHFPGPIQQDELPEWYRSADVILSLLDRTNTANPVMEAMACGRIAVALEAGTAHRLITDGETGILLGRQSLPKLGEILARLLEDRERMNLLGENAARAIRSLVPSQRQRLDLEVDLLEELARTRGMGRSPRAGNSTPRPDTTDRMAG